VIAIRTVALARARYERLRHKPTLTETRPTAPLFQHRYHSRLVTAAAAELLALPSQQLSGGGLTLYESHLGIRSLNAASSSSAGLAIALHALCSICHTNR
jgi:hypothetical protein